ncbi:hypothetical protein GCM10009677_58200 [Sphaerisporangium rubeum]
MTDRIVKYIANSAAKNMSSEDSQTIVPTLTRLGRRDDAAVVVVTADAVATGSIIAASMAGSAHDPLVRALQAYRTGHMAGSSRLVIGLGFRRRGPGSILRDHTSSPTDSERDREQHEGSRLQRRRKHA